MKNARTSKMETKIKRVLIRTVFVLMVATVFAVAMPANVSAATITVPDDYLTIQLAINAASAGDTVYVRSGTYYEHVTIGKSLTLQGENRETTIIDAGGAGNAIYVTANYVTIEGVTTTKGEHGICLIPNYSINHIVIRDCIVTLNTGHALYGIHVGGYITIENCEVSKNEGYGIRSHQFYNSVIKNCNLFENAGGHTINIAWCSNSSIVNCDVYSNSGNGILLDSTWNCTVEGNNVWDNGAAGAGIIIYRWGGGYNNTVRDNVVSNNGLGISLHGGSPPYNNLIYHNDIISNGTQARDFGSTNKWDNGYPSGGNYWSDYTGVDLYSGAGQNVPGSDGIGDTPYMIDADSKDNYPLVRCIYVEVEIDIKPGSYPNSINPNAGGVIPVAILTTDIFDASTVNPETVALDGVGARGKGKSGRYGSMEDVDGDGDLDLVVQVVNEIVWADDATEATLTGETLDGIPIQGTDTVNIVPPE